MDDNDRQEAKVGPPTESFVKKLLYALGGFVVVPLVGAGIAAFFQERNWSNENRNTRINTDMQNALAIGSKVTTLTNERYSALLQLADLMHHQDAGHEAWPAAYEHFLATNKEWEVGFTDFMSQLKFYVDAPFGVDIQNPLLKASPDDCTQLREGRKLNVNESRAAAFYLAVLNNCYGRIKDEIDRSIADNEMQKAPPHRAHLANVDVGLPHVWHVNGILRCAIDGRVLQIRKSLDELTFIGSLFNADAPKRYVLPEKEMDCLAEYEASGGASEPHGGRSD